MYVNFFSYLSYDVYKYIYIIGNNKNYVNIVNKISYGRVSLLFS